MAFNAAELEGLGMDMEVSAQPILKIIQDLSAEVKKSHKDAATKRIEGAESGDIVFNPDRTTYKELEVIVIKQTTLYAEWRPATLGGGLVGHHDATITQHKDYKPRDPNNKKSKEMLGQHELVRTKYFAVLFKHANGNWVPGIIPMSMSQNKTANAWIKMIMGFRYPNSKEFEGAKPFSFSRSYILKTEVQTNAEGSWYGWAVKPGRVLSFTADEALLLQGKEFAAEVDATLPAPTTSPALAIAAPVDEKPF